jgi:hypothetical protein
MWSQYDAMKRFHLCVRTRTVPVSTKTPNFHIQVDFKESLGRVFLTTILRNVPVNYVLACSPHLHYIVTKFNSVGQITGTQQTPCGDRIISECGQISEPRHMGYKTVHLNRKKGGEIWAVAR